MSKVIIDFLSPRKASLPISPYSREQTDDQVVRQSLSRDLQRKPLNVKDFFTPFGDWSPMYSLVIVLNGLCWMMGATHDLVIFVGSQPKSVFEYSDCQGCVYSQFGNTTLISEQKYGSDKQFLGSTAGTSLHFFGQFSGAIALSLFYRFCSRTIILFCGIFYTIFVAVTYTKYLPLVKLSIIMCAALSQMSRLSAMMHCMQSVPHELRPFAYVLMEAMGVLGSLIHFILFHVLDDWFFAVAIFAVSYVLVGLLYFVLCPPSALRSLATANRKDMDHILCEYAVSNSVVLDVDCLIDDVLYKRTAAVYVSKWEIMWDLVTSVDFIWKFICIILILTMGFIMTPLSRDFVKRNTYMGFFEAELIRQVFVVWANNLMAFLIYFIGRRHTIKFGIWLLVTTHFLALQIDISFFNLMIEHVPVNCHAITVPLGVALVEMLKTGWYHLSRALESAVNIHANFALLISGSFGIIVMTVAVLGIDDSGFMPITSADIPCYYRPHEKYKQQQPIRDDERSRREY